MCSGGYLCYGSEGGQRLSHEAALPGKALWKVKETCGAWFYAEDIL